VGAIKGNAAMTGNYFVWMHESMNLTASDSKPNYCISMSIISRFGDSLPPLRCTNDPTAADGKQHLTNPYMPKLYFERYTRLDRVQRKRDKSTVFNDATFIKEGNRKFSALKDPGSAGSSL
jgi:hypothetical protein